MINWDEAVLAPCFAVFGEPGQYLPQVGDPYGVNVIYDEVNKDLTINGVGEVNSSAPVVGIRQAELRGPAIQGDRVLIERTGEIFVVRDPDPDGHGNIKLKLNFVGPR